MEVFTAELTNVMKESQSSKTSFSNQLNQTKINKKELNKISENYGILLRDQTYDLLVSLKMGEREPTTWENFLRILTDKISLISVETGEKVASFFFFFFLISSGC